MRNNKNLFKTLSDVYIGSDYKCILDIEKRIEQTVLQCIIETGGFCLPDFVKRDVNIWFAVDNIYLLEDMPTGQNTFHGTVIVLNQREEDGKTVNQPLVLPTKALDLSVQVGFEVMAMHDKSYTTSCTDLPPIKENGWSEHQGAYVPVMCLSLPAPQAVIELTKCGYKSNCKGQCSCFKNGLPCTPLCKCFGKKTVQIHSKMTHGLMTRKRRMLALVHKNLGTYCHIFY